MTYDFKNIKRCGARCRTKNGGPCLGPAMANGRCRMHNGGALKKHGRATKKAKFERKQEKLFFEEMLKINSQIGDM